MGKKLFLRRTLAAALSGAMLVAACPMAQAAQGAETASATIGGGGAKLVYVTMGAGRTAEVALAGGSVHKDASADALVQSVTADGNSSVVAAVNGGFFNSYYKGSAAQSFPDNCPRIYSTVVRDGQLVNGLGQANLLGVTWDGVPYIDNVKYGCTVLLGGSVPLGMWAVNNYFSDAKSVSLMTDAFTLPVVTQPSSRVLTIKDGKVTAIAPGGTYRVPQGASLLIYNAGAVEEAQKWNQFPSVGDTAAVSTQAISCKRSADLPAWQNMKTAVAGGRMLLQNTYDVTADASYNAAFDSDEKQSNRGAAQRSFAAVMKDGRLLLGTAASATFPQIAAYLKGAGAVNAISLDGGASSMLYAAGVGNLTPAGRPLASAFVIVDEKVHETKPAAPVVSAPPTGTIGTASSEPSAWATEKVARGSTLGLIPAWLQNQYRSNITRREFCVLIVTLLEKKTGKAIDAVRGAAGKPFADAFSDTDDFYVRECASLGIVTGAENRFRPSDSLSRQEAAAILQRAAKVLGKSAAGAGKTFSDAAQMDAWAVEPIAFVTSLGIMNGDGAAFKPLGTFTREEAYLTMVNAYEGL